jgi:hypothetical protein
MHLGPTTDLLVSSTGRFTPEDDSYLLSVSWEVWRTAAKAEYSEEKKNLVPSLETNSDYTVVHSIA